MRLAPCPCPLKPAYGFNEVDLTWHELLLKQKLNALSIHGRTKKQISSAPSDWQAIGEIRALRDKLSPDTAIIGNGDVLTRAQGLQLADQYSLDGIMIGRGIFHDPYVFHSHSPRQSFTKEQRVALYKKHVELFIKTYYKAGRPLPYSPKVHTLNKFCKIYINNFAGAKELREALMRTSSAKELLGLLESQTSASSK